MLIHAKDIESHPNFYQATARGQSGKIIKLIKAKVSNRIFIQAKSIRAIEALGQRGNRGLLG
jgi:hypothetical protein